MSKARLFLGLPLAGLYLAVVGPARRLAQARGSDWGRWAPVGFDGLLCRILRIRVRRLGAPSATGPRLIVSNHLSWMDILVLGSFEPMTFLAKREVGESFLARNLAGLQGIIYVDRKRWRLIPKTNADMAATMRTGEPVVLFAEATTSDGNRVLRFRSSHFEAARAAGPDAVVQPVYLDYRRLGGLRVSRHDRPTLAWYGDMTFLPHLFRLLIAGGVSCEAHFGEPIRVGDFPDRKALARATEAAVRRLAEGTKGL